MTHPVAHPTQREPLLARRFPFFVPAQPPQCNRCTVGATLVSPGTPPLPNPHARPTSTRNPPQPPTHNATGQLCRSGTGRHEWRPYELRRKTTDAKQRSAAAMQQTHRRGDTCVARNTVAWNTAARNTAAPQPTRTPHLIAQPARIRRHPTRPVNCAVPAPGVINGAPTSYAAKQPTRNNVQPPQCSRRTVGATLVSPGTPPPGTPPPQSTRTPPSTRNPTARFPLPEPERVSRMYPYGDRKNDTPARKNGDCSRQNWQGIHPKMRGNRKTFCLLTFFTPPIRMFHACCLILAHLPIRNQTPRR